LRWPAPDKGRRHAHQARRPPVPSHPFRWLPEFLDLSRRRLRPQARLLGLALLVGVIAGLGAVVFFAACQVVAHYGLDAVSLEEVLLASQSPALRTLVVAADLMRGDVTPLVGEDRLDRALELFVESDLLALPVVENLTGRRVVGVVKRADVSATYLRHVHAPAPDESVTAA